MEKIKKSYVSKVLSIMLIIALVFQAAPMTAFAADADNANQGSTTAVTGIEVSSASDTCNTTLQMSAAVSPDTATNKNVSWSVDNTSVATIDQTGLLTASASGSAIVTATATDGSGVSGTKTIAVNPKFVAIDDDFTDWSKIYSYSDGLFIDHSGANNPSYGWINGMLSSPDKSKDDYIVYKSINMTGFSVRATKVSNAKTAGDIGLWVSGDGQNYTQITDYHKEVTAGDWEHTVYTEDGLPSGTKYLKIAFIDGFTWQYNVNHVTIYSSTAPVQEIKVSSASDSCSTTLQMNAGVTPSYAANKNVVWFVDKTDIATIDENGLLTAIANGTVVVTATAADGSGVYGTKTISVFANSEVINFNSLSANGTANTADTTELTITFDKAVTGITRDDITVTGAEKGELSGEGPVYTLTISDITVNQDEEVTVSVNKSGYGFLPASKSVAVNKAVSGTIYYVDSAAGNDANNGVSESTPWKSLDKVNAKSFAPGDKILFKAGGVWKGQLHPLGSGNNGNPIIIDMYGEGAKPLIDGDGRYSKQVYDESTNSLNEGAVVLLYNQNYWEINNLEVTNKSDNEQSRFGILVRWHNYGTGQHVYVKNCDIHDISGRYVDHTSDATNDRRFQGDGILIVSTGTVKGGTQTNYNDILIENNTLKEIYRTGITIWSQWANRSGSPDYSQGSGYYSFHTTVGAYKASTNVVIRDNNLDKIAGDGILVNTTKNCLIEWNKVKNCNYYSVGDPNAGIWPHNSDGTIMQYNEVSYTRKTNDGESFDVDFLCHDTIIQYNYSHDNEGGFLLIMGNAVNTTVRYNVSQRDACGVFHNNSGQEVNIYNNTFYMTAPIYRPNTGAGALFKNNIFYAESAMELGANSSCAFSNNAYYHIKTIPEDANAVVTDPKFADPGAAADGRDTVAAYQLKAASPCINTAALISNNGGMDFFSKQLDDIQDIGAIDTLTEGGNAPVVNYALGGTVTASEGSVEAWGWSKDYINDGLTKYGDSGRNGYHSSISVKDPNTDTWVIIDFGKAATINRIVLDTTKSPVDFTINTWDSVNEVWVPQVSKTDFSQTGTNVFTFSEPVTTNKIKLDMTKLRSDCQVQIQELAAYYIDKTGLKAILDSANAIQNPNDELSKVIADAQSIYDKALEETSQSEINAAADYLKNALAYYKVSPAKLALYVRIHEANDLIKTGNIITAKDNLQTAIDAATVVLNAVEAKEKDWSYALLKLNDAIDLFKSASKVVINYDDLVNNAASPLLFGGSNEPMTAHNSAVYPLLQEAGYTFQRGSCHINEVLPANITLDDYKNNTNNCADPATWDWSRLSWIDSAKNIGMTTMINLLYAPTWLTYNGKYNGVPKDWDVYQDIIKKIIKRYESKLDYIEILNEPDYFMNLSNSPYTSLSIAADDTYYYAVRAIRAINTTVKVGGIAVDNERKGGDFGELGTILRDSRLSATDIQFVSHHVYSSDPVGNSKIDSMQALLSASGRGDLPIFITEWNGDLGNANTDPNTVGAKQVSYVGMALLGFMQQPALKGTDIFALTPYDFPLDYCDAMGYIVPQGIYSWSNSTATLASKANTYRLLSKDLLLGDGDFKVYKAQSSDISGAVGTYDSSGKISAVLVNDTSTDTTTNVTLNKIVADNASNYTVHIFTASSTNNASIPTQTLTNQTISNGTMKLSNISLPAYSVVGVIISSGSTAPAVIGYANVALGGTVTASEGAVEAWGWSKIYINDGLTQKGENGRNGYHSSISVTDPNTNIWVAIDFGKAAAINKIVMDSTKSPVDFTIDTWDSINEVWVPQVSQTSFSQAGTNIFTFKEPVTTNKIRLNMTKLPMDCQVQIQELAAYYIDKSALKAALDGANAIQNPSSELSKAIADAQMIYDKALEETAQSEINAAVTYLNNALTYFNVSPAKLALYVRIHEASDMKKTGVLQSAKDNIQADIDTATVVLNAAESKEKDWSNALVKLNDSIDIFNIEKSGSNTFVDDFIDWLKLYSCSDGLFIDHSGASNPDYGWNNAILSSPDEAKGDYIVYKTNGMTGFSVRATRVASATTNAGDIGLWISSDGQNYTQITDYQKDVTDGDWEHTVYTKNDLPSGTQYLKITFVDGYTWTYNINNVAIYGAADPVKRIDVSSTGDTLNSAELQMKVSIYPSFATNKNVVWSVSDTNAATIDTTGLLKAKANGTVTVTATAADGSGIYGTKTITITGVTPPTTTTPTVPPAVTQTPAATPTAAPTVTPIPNTEKVVLESKNGKLNLNYNHEINNGELKVKLEIEPEGNGQFKKNINIPIMTEGLLQQLNDDQVEKINIEVKIPDTIIENSGSGQANLILPSEAFKMAAKNGKDQTISVKDQNGQELYSWTFDGTDLQKSKQKAKDVNLTLHYSGISGKQLMSLLKEKQKTADHSSYMLLDFDHKGMLPSQASVKVYVKDQAGIEPGDKVYLYHVNHETNKLDTLPYSSEYTVDKDGYITIKIVHCSEYIVTKVKAASHFVASLLEQIKVLPKSNTLYVGASKYSSIKLNITLPSTLEMIKSLKDNTSSNAIGGVAVHYLSSNSKVAKVDKNGNITATGAGKVTISAKVTLYSGKTKVFKTNIVVKNSLKS